MLPKRKLKLVICIIMLIDTGAMEGSSVFKQSDDDFQSLELCTAKNQQRLGSVFGNFTRHHKKGHRRRTTTTPPTTIEVTTDYRTSTEIHNYPKPLRLSASVLDKDYPESLRLSGPVIDKDYPETLRLSGPVIDRDYPETLKDELGNFIQREKHKDVENEMDLELNSRHSSKVKKMYRDAAPAGVNKVGVRNKAGIFLTDNCTTVIAQIGTTAILHCEVSDITENTVTWIRRKDYSLLSVGLVTYSADSRFFSAHGRHVKDWALHIRFATSADAGYYECQVPTHPPTSIFFKLALVAAYADIVGESEKIIHEGSMLRLVCQVKRSTEPPSYVFWYFENRMINYDLNGVTVHNGRQTSELVIGKAEPRHAGNYTCVPANARASSVTVHVVQSETPAAMQHGNNSSSSKTEICANIIVLYVVCYLNIIFHEYG